MYEISSSRREWDEEMKEGCMKLVVVEESKDEGGRGGVGGE